MKEIIQTRGIMRRGEAFWRRVGDIVSRGEKIGLPNQSTKLGLERKLDRESLIILVDPLKMDSCVFFLDLQSMAIGLNRKLGEIGYLGSCSTKSSRELDSLSTLTHIENFLSHVCFISKDFLFSSFTISVNLLGRTFDFFLLKDDSGRQKNFPTQLFLYFSFQQRITSFNFKSLTISPLPITGNYFSSFSNDFNKR